jgi:hypothetical protein
MTDYQPWDQEEKLGPPPWNWQDKRVLAWEEAHGHDVRLKCYVEFGCRVAWMDDARAAGWTPADEPSADTASSASRQHYIDTGRYLPKEEA